MLLICSSCNSKYLLNSADLKPKGRNVKCSICGNVWFQEPKLAEETFSDSFDPTSFREENFQSNSLP